MYDAKGCPKIHSSVCSRTSGVEMRITLPTLHGLKYRLDLLEADGRGCKCFDSVYFAFSGSFYFIRCFDNRSLIQPLECLKERIVLVVKIRNDIRDCLCLEPTTLNGSWYTTFHMFDPDDRVLRGRLSLHPMQGVEPICSLPSNRLGTATKTPDLDPLCLNVAPSLHSLAIECNVEGSPPWTCTHSYAIRSVS